MAKPRKPWNRWHETMMSFSVLVTVLIVALCAAVFCAGFAVVGGVLMSLRSTTRWFADSESGLS